MLAVPAIAVPNILALSGQGENSSFMVTSSCAFMAYELRLYDRWGGRVYHSTDAGQAWRGMRDTGSPLGSGVYVGALRYRWEGDAEDRYLYFNITVLR